MPFLNGLGVDHEREIQTDKQTDRERQTERLLSTHGLSADNVATPDTMDRHYRSFLISNRNETNTNPYPRLLQTTPASI